MFDSSQTPLTLYTVGTELRVRDVDLGAKLGFSDPRMIRKLIKSHDETLNRINVLYAQEISVGELGGRPGTEFYLDRMQAIYICMKSETSNAIEVQLEITKVYDTYLSGKSVVQTPATYIEALEAHLATVKRNAQLEAEKAALVEKVEVDAPFVEMARALTSETSITRRDFVAMLKTDHSLKVKEKEFTQWLIDNKYCYKDALTGNLRAYAQFDYLFHLQYELLNGGYRPLLKVTGEGVMELTPKVLAYFKTKKLGAPQ